MEENSAKMTEIASVSCLVKSLVQYGIDNALIEKEDEVYTRNSLLEVLQCPEYEEPKTALLTNLEDILSALLNYAIGKNIIEDTVTNRDLFDTKLMGILTPRPSEVIRKFNALYKESPEAATNEYYRFSRATDYIRTYRVCKDLHWAVPSCYGDIEISINLSKPEKDPKAIAAAKNAPSSSYPKCAICREAEGYAGTQKMAARQNHRLIPVQLNGEDWFLQYSPYTYYNEHCIVLGAKHEDMNICPETFVRLFDFLDWIPHYFIGSNADLPIVGGSILTHNHFQGGRHTFPMEVAEIECPLTFKGFEDVTAGIVKWPLSVIRLTATDRRRIEELSSRILAKWRGYTDESAFIFPKTGDTPHNTITPIARKRDGKYEMDLVLRNNITTKEHPLGVYHPHEELWNIKKENIGLIEVMGLAILPDRLKAEMAEVREAILAGKDIRTLETVAKHADWLDGFKGKYEFTAENTEEILHTEIGNTFVKVLEDAGVYKCTEDGRKAFMRFIASVNE